MAKAVQIDSNGMKSIVEFEIGNSYDVISRAVGGWIECVNLRTKGVDMWVNEEGKLNSLAENPIGTALYLDEFGNGDFIVGNILITGGVDHEGETLGLTDEQVAEFCAYDRRVWTLAGFTRDSFM